MSVAVLAVFLIAVAATARSIADHLAVLVADLREVDRHVGAIGPTAAQINGPLDDIVEALPLIATEAEELGRPRQRQRWEAAMTLWWIGNIVLIAVVIPVVVVILRRLMETVREIQEDVEDMVAMVG